MGFLLACPNCGQRDVYEFRFGGEVHARPQFGASKKDWMDYVYRRSNTAGVENEWWYHRMGCRRWFQATRDTTNNSVLRTFWTDQEGSDNAVRARK
ncbi:MAG: sarcosine oxidase subunit delta [Thaumarchaeota archaeon]|nr:sarcosine oxidase subunit delta [Nitrososphaerota archaeon]